MSDEQTTGHKLYDGVDENESAPSSLNIQSLNEGINHLEGVEKFTDTQTAFRQQNPSGGEIKVDKTNVIRMHTVYCVG